MRVLACAHMARCARGQARPASASKLPPVHLDGTYFTADGKRFLPVGAHWVPAKAAMQWNVEWDPKDIEADFAKMHELGYTITRFDVMWAWFEPRPGRLQPRGVSAVGLSGLARAQIQNLPASQLVHRRRSRRSVLGCSVAIGPSSPCGPGYAAAGDESRRGIWPPLRAMKARIIGWDLTDEPPFWIVPYPQTTDSMAINWTRLIVDGIREHDKLHPIVVGTSGEEVGHGPFRADNIAKFVDFFSVHPFTLYSPDLFPDALLSARGTYGAAFEIDAFARCRSSGDDSRDGRLHRAVFSGTRGGLRPRANVFRSRSGKHRCGSVVLHGCLAGTVSQSAVSAYAAGNRLGHDHVGPPGQAAGARIQEILRKWCRSWI